MILNRAPKIINIKKDVMPRFFFKAVTHHVDLFHLKVLKELSHTNCQMIAFDKPELYYVNYVDYKTSV